MNAFSAERKASGSPLERNEGPTLRSLKASPFRPGDWFGIPPIKDIVHHRENPSRVFISGDEPDDQPVGKRPGMAPGADFHAYAAVGPGFGPVFETGFIVQFPFQGSVEFRRLFILRDGL